MRCLHYTYNTFSVLRYLLSTQGLTKAFPYTQLQNLGAITPLYQPDKTLATDKQEEVKLLFQGTSIV
ncbi:hypothetical protein CROQUDRAFT_43093 [Cronartium quercuum f. sp. fusiforme G11]|uniref:Uncharacterized protein n=1 Tax=Cronartium quercuum f. sp. fusiforme G11 TaxID=708437 RepID=A0A9P6NPR8_9BASI|nr:hypothetical protein CROQUDRAFT_43093 [Cronartium quercuum f. sp. fusiforme G11]